MLLDTNILIYACKPGGEWLTAWTQNPGAAMTSVTRIEALGYAISTSTRKRPSARSYP